MYGLPKIYHRDDKEFIKRMLGQLPTNWRPQALDMYNKTYQDSLYNDPKETSRVNKARNKANTWLRAFVQEYRSKKHENSKKNHEKVRHENTQKAYR